MGGIMPLMFEGVKKKEVQFSNQENMGLHGSFCEFCSKHGDIAEEEAAFEDSKRLTEITNAVEDVDNNFMFLQKIPSLQEMERQAASRSLEESRLNLLAKVAQHKGRGGLDVVAELNACFGSENDIPFNWDFDERLKKNGELGVHHNNRRFLSNCIRNLLIRWKWQKVGGIAVKIFMVSVSISSLMSISSRKSGSLLTISKSPVDVFCGKG